MNSKTTDYVKADEEKVYRQKRLKTDCSSLFDLNRTEVLAKNVTYGKDKDSFMSYLDAYRCLYK